MIDLQNGAGLYHPAQALWAFILATAQRADPLQAERVSHYVGIRRHREISPGVLGTAGVQSPSPARIPRLRLCGTPGPRF